MKVLRLTHRQTGGRIVFSGPTHFGRFGRVSWAVTNREKNPLFDSLEACVQILDRKVSRNHAGIYREGEDFVLIDFNSHNGTSLNGELIDTPHEGVKLRHGDIIEFAGGKVTYTVGIRESQNYALLVGGGEDHLGALENGMGRLETSLKQRGYLVERMIDPTKQIIRNAFDRVKHYTTPDSHFIFSFQGHGGPNGIHLNGQILNPRELYGKIRQIRGKKSVLIDACNAGLYVNDHNKSKIPERTLVLTSSGQNVQAGETAILDGHCSRFAIALSDYLDANPNSFDLRDFYHDCIQSETLGHTNLRLQDPMMEGASYTVPAEICNLDHTGM